MLHLVQNLVGVIVSGPNTVLTIGLGFIETLRATRGV
jgi:hypothetical protein